jgi:hypothetical protein
MFWAFQLVSVEASTDLRLQCSTDKGVKSMYEGSPRSKERRIARWTAKSVVLTVLSFLLVAVLSTAAMAGANPVKVGSVATGKNPYSVCV